MAGVASLPCNICLNIAYFYICVFHLLSCSFLSLFNNITQLLVPLFSNNSESNVIISIKHFFFAFLVRSCRYIDVHCSSVFYVFVICTKQFNMPLSLPLLWTWVKTTTKFFIACYPLGLVSFSKGDSQMLFSTIFVCFSLRTYIIHVVVSFTL